MINDNKIIVAVFFFIEILVCAPLENDSYLFKLSIIHFNDIHARFEETSPISTRCLGNNCIGGISRLYTAILKLQKEQENSIVLNAGDSFQGTLWYNLFRWNVTQYFLNKLPCDAYTLGNHDFDDDINGVVSFMKSLNCPIIVANMDAKNEPSMLGLFQKSIVIVKNGTRIGVIGVILSSTDEISNTGKLKFTNEIESINEEAKNLVKNQNCSIIIVLSHCGIQIDRKIARETGPHVGLVVGGHSHTFLYTGDVLPGPDQPSGPYPIVERNKFGGKVLVVQSMFNTRYLGNLTVWFDKNGNVRKFEGNPIYLDHNIPQDPNINEEIKIWKKEVDKSGSVVLGKNNVFLDRSTRRSGECNIGSFFAEAMVDSFVDKAENGSWTYAAISVVNSGSIRTSLLPGNITTYDLISCQPFDNTIDCVELSGKNIKDFLEYSVTPTAVRKYQMHEFLQVSGIRVIYNISNPVGNRILSLKLRCNNCLIPSYTNVNYSHTYRVVVPSYIARGGDGYKIIKENMKNRIIGDSAFDVFSKYFVENVSDRPRT